MLEVLGESHHLTNFLSVSSNTASVETLEGKREPFKAFMKGSSTPSDTEWKGGPQIKERLKTQKEERIAGGCGGRGQRTHEKRHYSHFADYRAPPNPPTPERTK